MTLDELIAEGESLERPSWILRPEPTDSGVVACWGGERHDEPNAVPPEATALRNQRHIVTLSETLLAKTGVPQGPVSLFELVYADGNSTVLAKSGGRFQVPFKDLRISGEPLFATEERSFPPFAAVCLYGSSRVADWLAKQGLARHDYLRVTDELQTLYTSEWNRRSAFCRNAGDVIVGGWHFLWPDDHFLTPPELKLVALTLRDAEPWLELWYSPYGFGFHVRERIS